MLLNMSETQLERLDPSVSNTTRCTEKRHLKAQCVLFILFGFCLLGKSVSVLKCVITQNREKNNKQR